MSVVGVDVVGDLRRPLVWPAKAGSVYRVMPSPGVVAGLVAVLARWTRPDEVVLGLPAGGSVVRVEVAGDPGFAELARRVDAAWAGPEVTGSGVAGLLGPVVVAVIDGVVAESGPEVIDVDLVVTVAPHSGALRVDYAVEEFSAGWVHSLLDQVTVLTEAAAGNPGQRLSQLPLLTDTARQQLLQWGQGPTRPIPQQPIHELVLEWARRTPQAVAGVAGGESITYQQLDHRSEVLAKYLCSAGISPGDIVSIALDRGIWTLIATLAVLRAGAAYTPMDVSWPAERMRMLLADHGARIVLTTSDVTDRIPRPDGVRVLTLDHTWPTTNPQATVPLPVVDPSAAAFVIYTSGSTGTPKGVVLTHEMLTNFLAWMREECAIGPGSRMLHCCAPIFDAALAEIYAALIAGARVVVCSRDTLLDPRELTKLIAGKRVSHAFCPPTNVAAVNPADCPTLTCLLLGGEPLPPNAAKRWNDVGARVLNAYGPAEASVACTWFDTSTGWPGTTIPIGWPMPNRNLHVVDPDLNLVAVGVPGEILITGHGVAAEYLNRPQLTAQRFITDPHTGTVAYRSGDLARWNTTGALEFLTRIDTQVKINGIRIELGEIEATLEQHPDVHTAAVTTHHDNNITRLIGYITARPGSTPDPNELRRHLATTLPAYMIPAAVITLDRFPLGGTGKIDRSALPAPTDQRPDLSTPYTPPVTPQEHLITDLYTTILNIKPVGTHDSFFHLGGTSLQTAALATTLDQATNTPIPTSQIHRTPTPHQLAQWLSTTTPRTTTEPATSPATRQRPGPVPLPLAVAKFVYLAQEMVCPITWWIEGDLNLGALIAALGDIHQRHQALHARYRRTNPPVALIPPNPGGPKIHLLNDSPTTGQALDAITDTIQQPLDYTQGRNWHAAITRDTSTNRTLLGIGIHHIAYDGWSHAILVNDLTHAYTARRTSQPPTWPQPAPTLRQAHHEHTRLRNTADLTTQRTYWHHQLHGLTRQGPPPTTTLQQFLAWGPKAGHTTTIPNTTLQPWNQHAHQHHYTPTTYYATAYATALHTIHQQNDIAFLIVTAQRGNPTLDNTLTTRTNLNCVRVRFEDGGSDDLVLQVHRTLSDLMTNQDIPFAETADDPVAGISSGVVASLPTFIYQDNPQPRLELPGCRTDEVVEPYAREVPNGLTVEVLPRSDHALLRITIRTDLLPYSFAEELSGHMLRFLEAGPLERALPKIPNPAVSVGRS